MSNSDIELCYKIIAYETVTYKMLRDNGKLIVPKWPFNQRQEWSVCSLPCWHSQQIAREVQKLSNADIKLCFKMIDLEQEKMVGFINNRSLYWETRSARNAMQRMLAALLGVPVERLEEIRKIS